MEDWDNLPFVDYMNFTYEWLKEVKRVLKPTGLFGFLEPITI